MADKPPKPEDRPSSPRFKKRRQKPQQKSRDVPGDLTPIMAELKKQSDRGAAIIAGSLLERILEAAIKRRLRPLSSDQWKALFGGMAPLSTFSAKIEIGFAIGLYSEAAYKNLNMVREVRNNFAHEFDALSFNHPSILTIVNGPTRPRLAKSDGSPRGEFMLAFAAMGSMLLTTKFVDVRLPHLGETHGAVLREAGRALNAALRKQAQQRQTADQGSAPPTSQPRE